MEIGCETVLEKLLDIAATLHSVAGFLLTPIPDQLSAKFNVSSVLALRRQQQQQHKYLLTTPVLAFPGLKGMGKRLRRRVCVNRQGKSQAEAQRIPHIPQIIYFAYCDKSYLLFPPSSPTYSDFSVLQGSAVGRAGVVAPLEMVRLRRKMHLAAAFCLLGFSFVLTLPYFWTQNNSSLPKRIMQRGKDVCKGRTANSSISALSDNRTFVIAAYVDYRIETMTRIIGIVHHEEVRQFHCWFCCSARDKAYVSKAVINIHSDRFGFPYATADFLCLETAGCEPRYVALRQHQESPNQALWFEIRNRQTETYPVEFTVCISTMFGGYNNVLQFVQSVEMYKLLGVQKVVIYKTSCSPLMENVLEFYAAEGTVEVIPWPITSFLNVSTEWQFTRNGTQIGYYGQIAALNDCVYRNMYKSRYVLLNDVDEIILPVQYPDWKTLMRSLQEQNPQAGVFLFENHVFPNNVFATTDVPSWDAVPGVNILQHVLREPDRKEVINPRKMIVDPRKVVQTSVHSVLHGLGESVDVPMEIAMVYHCRTPFQPHLAKEALIKDTTLWRYNSSLFQAVNKVLQEMPLQYEKATSPGKVNSPP
ncbi:uncharacterized protein [Tiliqua scincoides]|uniref:uncharacterized protein n=1 Tax=Tiliqua scincoides TaxID=71010 RepID=UPI0034621526